MRNVYGKVFQNILTRDVEYFLYDPQQNYYDIMAQLSRQKFDVFIMN